MIRFLDWFIRSYLFGLSFSFNVVVRIFLYSSFVAVSIVFFRFLLLAVFGRWMAPIQSKPIHSYTWIVDIYMFTMNGISTQYYKSCGILFSYRLYLIAVYLHIYAHCQLTFFMLYNFSIENHHISPFVGIRNSELVSFHPISMWIAVHLSYTHMIFDLSIPLTNQW